MSAAKTVSVTLPPDLLIKAKQFAVREESSLNDLFRDAISTYLASDPEWIALRKRVRARTESLGITGESDVERLSDEYRSNKHA